MSRSKEQPGSVDKAPVDRFVILLKLRNRYFSAKGAKQRRLIAEQCAKATEGIDEHPEWWDMPCLCDSCKSSG